MTTVCAGRLTPHAKVAVQHKTFTTPAAKRRSTRVLSDRSMPALWQPKPRWKSSFTSLFLLRSTSFFQEVKSGWFSGANSSSPPCDWSFAAISPSCFAVLTVSLRLCTKTIACFPVLSAAVHLSYAICAMSICRFIALPSVTPTNICVSGIGLKLWSKTKRPASDTPRNLATSAGLGRVAESPTIRIMLCVVSTCLCVRATSVSITGPRSSFSRCTSSMMSSLSDDATLTSPPLRVITSHFSGVVTIMCVSSISFFVSCVSPVSSLTWIPSGANRRPNAPVTSAASAFIGAT